MLNDFLEIFKHSFKDCSLVGVKVLGKRNYKNTEYYKFIGKFQFEPLHSVFYKDLEINKKNILMQFRRITKESSNCFKRIFTKQLLRNKKVYFTYRFDIIPQNILDFHIDKENKKMYLYVIGYGMF